MWRHGISAVLLLSILAVEENLRADNAGQEFRGVWVARFGWASPNGERCRNNITAILDAAAENNLNAVVFQVRGAAETLYPSELEPWSPLVAEDGPGFDPVEFAITAAHRRGLQFHAYVNPMPLRSTGRKELPKDKRHLWYSHGPDSPEPWICVDEDGKPAATEYYYLSAGIPGVHVYLRKVILDLVRRYDVDGVHLDRIRYPGNQYSHDTISERRFRGQGNPQRKDRTDWQREQLDKLVNDLAAEIRALKPDIVMSCAAWGIYRRDHIDGYQGFSSGYHDYYQDTWNWVRIGAMDVLMPMIYWDLPEPKPNYDELLHDFLRGVGEDHLVGGQRVFSAEENVRQIQLTRDAGAVGTVLWSYRLARRKGILSDLRQTLYTSKVPVPQTPRVSQPKYGAILGKVHGQDGTPLVDAWVSIEPVDPAVPNDGVFTQKWPSSADGRFAFLKIPPVPVRITVRYRDKPSVSVGPIAIKAAEVANVNAVVNDAAEAESHYVSFGGDEPTKTERNPATLAEALALLEHRPRWTDRPDLNLPKHPAEKYLKGMTIVLDPGHGGGSRRSSDGNREADMNLRVGKLLEKLLRDAGVHVVMTRDGDHELSLADRSAVANQADRSDGGRGADLLISIHHNAGGRSANYTTVWFHGEADWSEPDLDVARYVGHALGEALRTDVGRTSPLMSDQQMYREGFGVLRHCNVPAILLECSFFSNPEENERLRDAFYNLREAYAVYRGLWQYAYGGRPSQSLPEASLESGVLQVTTVLDDGLPATWWGGDRQRILSSTISAYVDGQAMDVDYDPAEKKLVAKLEGLEVSKARTNVLRIHFANFFKHHNWPQRFAIRIDEAGNRVRCSPLPARRYQHPED